MISINPTLVSAGISGGFIFLGAAIAAIVNLLMGFRTQKQNHEKSIVEYLNKKIEKLEKAKEQIIKITHSNPNKAYIPIFTYQEVEYKFNIANRILVELNQYFKEDILTTFEKELKLIKESQYYLWCLENDPEEIYECVGNTEELLDEYELCSAMAVFFDRFQHQIDIQLREAVLKIREDYKHLI